MTREEMLLADATWLAKRWLTIIILGVLAFVGSVIATDPTFLPNWDKQVPCEIKGCDAVYAHRVQFKDGVERLCHDCYSFMVLNEEDK